MDNLDFDVFSGKSFKDLCKDVVERSQNKKDMLDTLISDLRSQIKGPNEFQAFMPRIKELMEVGVKNDEQLIKLCAVLQRLQSTQIETTGGDSLGLTDEEKAQLQQAQIRELEVLKEIKKEVDAPVLKEPAPTTQI